MIFNLNIKAKTPAQEETREVIRFAWMPKFIGSQVVWLGRYRQLQVWLNTTYPAAVMNEETGKMERKAFVVGKWHNCATSLK